GVGPCAGVGAAAALVVGVGVEDDLHPRARVGHVHLVVVVAAAGLVAVGVGVGDALDVGADLGALAAVGAEGRVGGGELDPQAQAVVGVGLPVGPVLGVVAGEAARRGVAGRARLVVRVGLGVGRAARQAQLEAVAADGVGGVDADGAGAALAGVLVGVRGPVPVHRHRRAVEVLQPCPGRHDHLSGVVGEGA